MTDNQVQLLITLLSLVAINLLFILSLALLYHQAIGTIRQLKLLEMAASASLQSPSMGPALLHTLAETSGSQSDYRAARATEVEQAVRMSQGIAPPPPFIVHETRRPHTTGVGFEATDHAGPGG